MKLFEDKVVGVTGVGNGSGSSIMSECEKDCANVAYIEISENLFFIGDL